MRARAPLPPGRRWALRAVLLAAVVLSPYLVTFSQSASVLGASISGLKLCPQSPRCVSSDLRYIVYSNTLQMAGEQAPPRPAHFVDPIELEIDSDEGWKALVDTVRL